MYQSLVLRTTFEQDFSISSTSVLLALLHNDVQNWDRRLEHPEL
jgi:hypothetical protein